MGRLSRAESFPADEINVVHCINRCVRRGFLCGKDRVSGQNYEHRREWIRQRFEFLAGVMGVEIFKLTVPPIYSSQRTIAREAVPSGVVGVDL